MPGYEKIALDEEMSVPVNNLENSLLSVKDLETSFHIEDTVINAVNKISFTVPKNSILGIVGESGSGKSVTARSILRLLHCPPCRISGDICFMNKNLLTLNQNEIRKVRGKDISMIFQEPMTSLNPVLTIGSQIYETIRIHQKLPKKEAWEKTIEALRLVRIPDPSKRANEYPHEMSGGMKQRAMIAMALSSKPALLIADEPTTALDVTIQKQILYLIKNLQKELDMAVIFITHDLGVIAEIADKVAVMYAGKILEFGSVNDIFHSPRHPYTLSLLRSIPRLDVSKKIKLEEIPGMVADPSNLPPGCEFHPRCSFSTDICRQDEPQSILLKNEQITRCWRHGELGELAGEKGEIPHQLKIQKTIGENIILTVVDLQKHFKIKGSLLRKKREFVKALDGVSLEIKQGEALGLVGESGCGKTTLGMCLLRLIDITKGKIFLNNREISCLPEREFIKLRKDIQIIFQDPYGSLNPRMKIGEIIREPLTVHKKEISSEEKSVRIRDMLEKVGLDYSFRNKFPHELSGGQRQRVAIARALIVYPKLVICDEPVSALDVSIQAQIINLLEKLKNEMDLTYLFISHDLSVVKNISDNIAIMYLGKIMEKSGAENICSCPKHPYTQTLISSVPIPDPSFKREYSSEVEEMPSPIDVPAGCRFHTRCSHAMEKCGLCEPELKEVEPGWFVACHRVNDGSL